MLLTQADKVAGDSMETEKPGSQQIWGGGGRYDYYQKFELEFPTGNIILKDKFFIISYFLECPWDILSKRRKLDQRILNTEKFLKD